MFRRLPAKRTELDKASCLKPIAQTRDGFWNLFAISFESLEDFGFCFQPGCGRRSALGRKIIRQQETSEPVPIEGIQNSSIPRGSAAQANADLIRRGYDAFTRGDIATVLAILAEDILWHVPGRGPLSQDYRGHGEVLGFFDRFMELSDRTFRIQIHDVLANSERVVVLCTESARRAGRSWSSPQVHVWTVKNGRATVFWQYQGDQQTEDEFWSA